MGSGLKPIYLGEIIGFGPVKTRLKSADVEEFPPILSYVVRLYKIIWGKRVSR
jgi:hypothetical protein